MATEPTPEDLFDVESWIEERPPLAKIAVDTAKGRKTLVLRAFDADDSDAVQRYVAEHPGVDETETLLARMAVGVFDGEPELDLDTLPLPPAPPFGQPWVRKLRKAIREVQWELVQGVAAGLAYTLPSVPSSPES